MAPAVEHSLRPAQSLHVRHGVAVHHKQVRFFAWFNGAQRILHTNSGGRVLLAALTFNQKAWSDDRDTCRGCIQRSPPDSW